MNKAKGIGLIALRKRLYQDIKNNLKELNQINNILCYIVVVY